LLCHPDVTLLFISYFVYLLLWKALILLGILAGNGMPKNYRVQYFSSAGVKKGKCLWPYRIWN